MYDISKLQDAMIDQGLNVLMLSRKSKVPEATIRGIFKKHSGHVENIKAVAMALGYTLPAIRADRPKNGKRKAS